MLSIVIPTYNRKDFVVKNLLALESQIERYSSDLEVFITDNASTDGTEEALKPIVDKYPNVSYHKHEKNLGAHANFYYGIKNASKEYVLLLGDDDVVFPYFCDVIFQVIKQHKDVSLIHYNYLLSTESLAKVDLFNKSSKDDDLICVYNNGSDFIKKYWNKPSFMSSSVFKRSCFLDGLNKCYHPDCYGYDWLLCLYYGVMKEKCVYLYMPLMIQNCGAGGYSEKWPLYSIVGISNVFRYLSKDIPSCYDDWMEYYQNQYAFYQNLSAVAHGKKVCKEHRDEFYLLLKKKDRILFNILLHSNGLILFALRSFLFIMYKRRLKSGR